MKDRRRKEYGTNKSIHIFSEWTKPLCIYLLIYSVTHPFTVSNNVLLTYSMYLQWGINTQMSVFRPQT